MDLTPTGDEPAARRPAGKTPTGHRAGPLWAGEELPALEIPVTRTLIVAGAVASRDYQDVHHDAEAAREKGSPDIFMNILTTNGLVGRYITDYLGPAAVLRRVAIRLGVPSYPGDTLVLTGRVTSVEAASGPASDGYRDGPADGAPSPKGAAPPAPTAGGSAGGSAGGPPGGVTGGVTAQVRVTGANSLGSHVTGIVTVFLPGVLVDPGDPGDPGATRAASGDAS
ncbi:hypothetical protein GUY61_31995 [Streptomyces sp. GC420]|nr:hypothetical protein [Streptomyces sp. GC420]